MRLGKTIVCEVLGDYHQQGTALAGTWKACQSPSSGKKNFGHGPIGRRGDLEKGGQTSSVRFGDLGRQIFGHPNQETSDGGSKILYFRHQQDLQNHVERIVGAMK